VVVWLSCVLFSPVAFAFVLLRVHFPWRFLGSFWSCLRVVFLFLVCMCLLDCLVVCCFFS